MGDEDHEDMVDCEKCSNNHKNGGKCGIDGYIFYACNKVILTNKDLLRLIPMKEVKDE